MNEFILENYDKIDIIFNEFKNVAVQNTMTSTFLPVNEENDDEDKSDTNYIFEPNQKDILNKLIPKALTANLFKTILESNASRLLTENYNTFIMVLTRMLILLLTGVYCKNMIIYIKINSSPLKSELENSKEITLKKFHSKIYL